MRWWRKQAQMKNLGGLLWLLYETVNNYCCINVRPGQQRTASCLVGYWTDLGSEQWLNGAWI